MAAPYISSDLNTGRLLQRSLLPQELPTHPGLDIAADLWTAVDLGGDYYQFLQQPGLLAVAIADSSGKSVAGAIHAALFKGQLDAYAQTGRLQNPVVVLNTLNQLLCDSHTEDAVALCYGVLDLEAYELSVGNAGMPGPFLYRAATGTCEEIVNPSMALGRFPGAPFRVVKRSLEVGDVVLFCSDGLYEARSPDGRDFGDKEDDGTSPLEKTLQRLATRSAREICQELKQAIDAFSGREVPEDDVSVAVFKLNLKVPASQALDCPYQEALQAWLRSEEQDTSALLRGKRLKEALAWCSTREVSRMHKEFLEASQRIDEKERLQAKLLEEAQQRAAAAERLEKLNQELQRSLEAERYHRLQAEIGELNERIVALTISAEALYNSNNHLEALIAATVAGTQLKRLATQFDRGMTLLKPNTYMRAVSALEQVVYGIHEYNRLEGHGFWVNRVRFSPDGQWIATASSDRTVKIWSVHGTLLQTLYGHTNWVTGVAFAPNGKLLASCSRDNTIKLWRWDDGAGMFAERPVQIIKGHEGPVLDVCFAPNGELVASASEDMTVRLWKLNGASVKILRGHERWAQCVAFHPSGKLLASGSADRTVVLWNLNGTVVRTLKGHDSFVESVAFDPKGQSLVSCGRDRSIRLWTTEGVPVRSILGHQNRVWEVCFSPDGSLIASASLDRTIKIWDTAGNLLQTMVGHGDGALSVSFSPDGQNVVSGSRDATAKLWNVAGNPLRKFVGHEEEITSATLSPAGDTIVTGGKDKRIHFWNAAGQMVATLQGHTARIHRVCFSPDGQTLLSAGGDTAIFMWRVADGSAIQTLTSHRGEVYGVTYRSDGQVFASCSADGSVRVWRADGTWLQTLNGHSGEVFDLAFSPDGTMLASVGKDKVVCLWSWDGKLLTSFEAHSAEIFAVCFSPDSQLFATAGMDQSVRIWQTDGTHIKTLNGHSAEVRALAFTPDGKNLVSGGDDSVVQLWGLDGTLLRSFTIHTGPVRSLQFSPNGKSLLSASGDRSFVVWNLDMDNLLVRSCRWLQSFLRTNQNVSEEDRRNCLAGCGWLSKNLQQKAVAARQRRAQGPEAAPEDDATQIQILVTDDDGDSTQIQPRS